MKRHPLHTVALEFLERFPPTRRFGRVWTEKELARVTEEMGWDAEELLWRIRQWSLTRTDLLPEQLVKPLPPKTIEVAAAPAVPSKRRFSPASAEWRRRTLWIYADYDEVDI